MSSQAGSDVQSSAHALVGATAPAVSESALRRARALGRRARLEGVGVLEMAAMLHRALERVSTPSARSIESDGAGSGFRNASETVARGLLSAWQDDGPLEENLWALNARREEDLRRVADQIHDSAFQLLTAVRLELQRAIVETESGNSPRFDCVRARIDDVEAELRRIAHELRPALLDDLGVLAALRLLADQQARRSGIDIAVHGSVSRGLGRDVGITLYRVAQEAIVNAVRHSKAHSVDVALRQVPGWVRCRVKDDGSGFDPASPHSRRGLGLIGMHERLLPHRGMLKIDSAPGRGTVVAADIPLWGRDAAPHPAG